MELIHTTEQQTDKGKSAISNKPVILKIFLMSFLAIALIAGLGIVSIGWAWNTYMTIYRGIDISLLGKEPPRSTVFYDSQGEIITELTNARMEYMPLDQFSPTVQEAVIAVEDSRFYEHKGVDFQGIARAFYHNWKSGDTVQGGSTITQQLAKTMLFSAEQTYSRKINEAVASIKIEKTYTKDQIMELYLNYIYFGEGSWGLERAAKSYFGKTALELELSEAALLAGIPKSPTNYSPVKKPEQAKERRDLVLNLMAEQGKITVEQRDAAIAEELKLTDQSQLKIAVNPSYIDYVMQEATQKYKLTEQQLLSSGYQIYTTMVPKVQNAAEEVYSDASLFPEDAGGLQSGVVLMHPQTGALMGIVGSRNPKREFREFNFATQIRRQPGSTLKPIVVYAPALSEGFGTRDRIHDVETDFGGAYTPANYGNKLHGWVTVEEALVQSYNIPAVALLKEIGIDKGIEFANKAGLPLEAEDRTLGIALGGMSKGTSPLAMAQAYTMFANNGNMAKAYAITKIVDRHGQLVGESQPVLEPMLDPNVAFTMTQMLEKAVIEGTGQSAQMDRPAAGKTGTTQLPDIPEFKDENGNQIDGSKDAWFVGYTPELVAAIWLGYEKTNKDHYLTTTGGKYPAALFKEVVTRALLDDPIVAFAEPEAYAAVVGGRKKINGEQEAIMLAAAAKKKAQAEKQAELAKAVASKGDTSKANNSKADTAKVDSKEAAKRGNKSSTNESSKSSAKDSSKDSSKGATKPNASASDKSSGSTKVESSKPTASSTGKTPTQGATQKPSNTASTSTSNKDNKQTAIKPVLKPVVKTNTTDDNKKSTSKTNKN
jgi:penicillin-binding protein 2A